MKLLLVAHAEDPDGIISRALLMRQFPSGKDNVFVRYDRIAEAFEEAVTKSSGCNSVYVADVNPNPRLVSSGFALMEKLSYGREVYWFDHHDATLRNKDRMAKLGIKVHHDEHHCAAMIIAQHYNLFDPYAKKIAKIAQAHDYKKQSKEARNTQIGNELEKVIAIANETLNYGLLLQLSEDLAEEKCFNKIYNLRPEWQQHVDKFNRRELEAYKDLDDSVEISKIGPYRVLFGYSSPLLSQKPGPFHLRDKFERDSDIFVCLFKSPVRNHMVLTNNGVSFPVVPFVQSLGGGGRDNGGGFTLDYDITSENYKPVKEMLLSQMDKYC